MTTTPETTGDTTMTINHNELKRLLAKFEHEYGFPLSMPSPSVYETAIVRLNDEMLAQAQRDGVVPRELQCERDQTEARWQMAMTFAPFVNALPDLLDDLEAAQKREQVLREAMTGLLEYVPSDAQLVYGGIAATDTPRNRALLKAHAALEAR
jgi:hypothetical protein